MKSFDLNSIIFTEHTLAHDILIGMNKTAHHTENKGFAIIVNEKNACVGVVTDGDLRNYLSQNSDLYIPISEILNKNFVYAHPDEETNTILRKFEKNILNLPILDKCLRPIGLLNYSKFSVFQRSREHIIRARAPGRISFSGGGTDMSEIFGSAPTSVLSTAIDKFCVTSLMSRDDDAVHIYSKDLNLRYSAENIDNIKWGDDLDLIKSAIKMMKPKIGFNIEISSEIEIGTGLGGSSAVVTSVLAALNELNPIKMLDKYAISDLAYQVERMEMKMAGGWQDQYSSVFGGVNWIEFNQDDILVNPLRIDRDTLLELHYNLMLFRVGASRKSSEIHQHIYAKKLTSVNREKFLRQMASNTKGIKKALLKGNVKEFGDYLHHSWMLKNTMNNNVSNKHINELYTIARDIGALGGKLLGAGRSGYLLLYASPLYQEKITEVFAERGVYKQNFNFNPNGVEIWKVPK